VPLVPLQALALGWGLFGTQRALLSPAAWAATRPRWYHGAGLALAFLAFGYLCAFQMPQVVRAMLGR
jgi:hypothetical protein